MNNVAPTRALARRSRQLLVAALVVGSLGTFVAIIGLALFMIPLVNEGSPTYGLYAIVRGGIFGLGALVFVVGVGMAVRAVTWRTDNDLAAQTARFMLQFPQVFDDRYTFIRNVSKLEIGYVDAILVGPPGVLVFRLLDAKGHFANEGANWLREKRRDEWVPARIDPTRECVADIKKLREYFAHRRLGEVPVFGIVLFTVEPPTTTWTAKNPVVPIAQYGSFISQLESNYLAKRDRISQAQVDQVVRSLYDPHA